MSLYKLTLTKEQTDRQKKQLIGAQAFALPKNKAKENGLTMKMNFKIKKLREFELRDGYKKKK